MSTPFFIQIKGEDNVAIAVEDIAAGTQVMPGVTTREDTKNFVRERCRTDRAFRQKTLHALQESGIDGWRPLHPARTSNKEDTAHADTTL